MFTMFVRLGMSGVLHDVIFSLDLGFVIFVALNVRDLI